MKIFLMKFLQTKPQIESMIILYCDLHHTAIKKLIQVEKSEVSVDIFDALHHVYVKTQKAK